jgi:hypothetical protein
MLTVFAIAQERIIDAATHLHKPASHQRLQPNVIEYRELVMGQQLFLFEASGAALLC